VAASEAGPYTFGRLGLTDTHGKEDCDLGTTSNSADTREGTAFLSSYAKRPVAMAADAW